MNIGVIGYGRHASSKLYPAFQLAGAQFSCVLTRSMSSARVAAAALDAPRSYDDIEAMLATERLDAAIVCVEPEDQAPITLRCIAAGVAVFVEKPLGMNVDEARQVSSAAELAGIPVMVGFMKRFAPIYRRLAEVVSDREKFGRILTVAATFSFAPWTTALREDSFLQQGAIHMLDILRAHFGAVVVEAGLSNSSGSDIGLAYTLRFGDGAVAAVSLSATQARENTFEHIAVTGSKAWAEAENLEMLRYRTDDQNGATIERWDSGDAPEIAEDLCREGFFGEAKHFLDRVSQNKSPDSSAADNVATMQMCDDMIAILNLDTDSERQ